jgi:uncharacterized protein Yka (UPF0111/DUF47 family)
MAPVLRRRIGKERGDRMDAREHPSGPGLFAALVELGEDLLAGAKLLREALHTPSPSRMNENLKHIRSLEEASNATVRNLVGALDPEDSSGPLSAFQVTMLLRYLDDAMDAMEEAAGFLQAYAIEQRADRAVKLASFLVRATEELLHCITGLRDHGEISSRVRAVAEIENEADEFYRAVLGHLMIFGSDPFHAMRWKDIYDRLEEAIDRCEETAQLLDGVSSRSEAGGAIVKDGGKEEGFRP